MNMNRNMKSMKNNNAGVCAGRGGDLVEVGPEQVKDEADVAPAKSCRQHGKISVFVQVWVFVSVSVLALVSVLARALALEHFKQHRQ